MGFEWENESFEILVDNMKLSKRSLRQFNVTLGSNF